jgi:dihydrofolate reductase
VCSRMLKFDVRPMHSKSPPTYRSAAIAGAFAAAIHLPIDLWLGGRDQMLPHWQRGAIWLGALVALFASPFCLFVVGVLFRGLSISMRGHTPGDAEVKASIFVGTSLDGFIARVDGALDFLPPGGGEPHGYEEFMATVDALIIGRKTYETVLDFDAWPYGTKPTFVLSTRSLAQAPLEAIVERMSGSPSEIVAQLDSRGVRHAYVDGGITIQRFLQAGLVQRLTITRVPVLIGAGVPLFGAIPRDIVLKHIATRQYASGLVRSEYEIAL